MRGQLMLRGCDSASLRWMIIASRSCTPSNQGCPGGAWSDTWVLVHTVYSSPSPPASSSCNIVVSTLRHFWENVRSSHGRQMGSSWRSGSFCRTVTLLYTAPPMLSSPHLHSRWSQTWRRPATPTKQSRKSWMWSGPLLSGGFALEDLQSSLSKCCLRGLQRQGVALCEKTDVKVRSNLSKRHSAGPQSNLGDPAVR